MDLLQLRYFAAAAKYQNISRAAEEFSIPQPAMSRTIRNLEKELGMPLFQRSSNKIILNKNGLKFYDVVCQTLKTLDNGITSLNDSNCALNGEIRLLILQYRNAMIDFISDFRNTYPNVRFTVYHSSIYPKDFEFDFCLASQYFDGEGLDKQLLFNEEIMLAVNDSHNLAKRKYVTIDDIKDEKFVSMPASTELGRTVHKMCEKYGFIPNDEIVCDDPFYVRKYVSHGMGAAFSPTVAWNGLWPDGTSFLHIENVDFTRQTYLYYPKTSDSRRECRIFRDFLLAQFIMMDRHD